jgi:hypothetical protein
MPNKFVIILLFTIAVSFYSCTQKSDELNPKMVVLIVENRLRVPLESSIQQYKKDLVNEGYQAEEQSNISSSTSPSEIRKILQGEYDKNKNLTGVVFIGNIAAPLFNDKESQGDPYWHDYLADFYYMDLDGIWEDGDNNGVLDEHKDTKIGFWNKIRKKLNLGDNRTPEIWVSRIRADMLSSLGDEVELLKKYFEKNHNYRTGKLNLPTKKAFVVSAGVNVLKSDWGASPGKIYSDIDVVQFQANLADTLRKFLKSENGYELGIINVFSGPRIHHFNHFYKGINPDWWKSNEGKKLIVNYSDEIVDSNDFNWSDIKFIQPKVLFYHLLTSEVGRHDYQDYLAGTYIFSGLGLAAIAGTQHSGSVGTPILYEGLVRRKSIGEAWKDALIWLVEHSEDKITILYFPNEKEVLSAGKSNYKAVLIGDGTLKLPER